MLRSVANNFIKMPQLCVQCELHKECFDELAGVTDLKRFELYWFAKARGLRDRTLSRSCAIQSHMNGHVRLEKRRVVLAPEIVDHSLKEAARRLRGNEPVSNSDSSGHKRANSTSAVRRYCLRDLAHRRREGDRHHLLLLWQPLPLHSHQPQL